MAERIINEEEEKSGKGGGNKNALAYGLLQKAGYNTYGMEPADAWALVDALKLMDRERRKKTDDDKANLKQEADSAKSRGVTKDTVVQKAGIIADRVALHSQNIAGTEKAIDTATQISREYGLNKLGAVKTSGHLGSGIVSAAASANGRDLNISRTFLSNPEAFVRSSYDFGKSARATIKQLEAQREKAIAENKMSIADKISGQIEKFQRQAKYNRHNFVRSGHAVEDVIAHEMGHVLADQLFGQINGSQFLKSGIDPMTAQHKRQSVEKSYTDALMNGDMYKISAYAATSPAEYFAECFAMRHAGEKLPPTAEQMMNVVFGG